MKCTVDFRNLKVGQYSWEMMKGQRWCGERVGGNQVRVSLGSDTWGLKSHCKNFGFYSVMEICWRVIIRGITQINLLF